MLTSCTRRNLTQQYTGLKPVTRKPRSDKTIIISQIFTGANKRNDRTQQNDFEKAGDQLQTAECMCTAMEN